MKTGLFAALAMLIASAAAARAQDKPTPITTKLPGKAECIVCASRGEEHGAEKPAGGVSYKGKAYYFCSKGEVAAFVQEPETFLPPVLPRPAPALTLPDLQGRTTTLAGLKNKLVLVDFWATWCGPCVKAMPDLQKLHDKFAGKNFTVVGVSVDEDGAKSVAPFLAKRTFTYPILLDTKGAWKEWKIAAIPAVMLVDGNGQIVRQWTGKIDKNEIEKAVTGLLK